MRFFYKPILARWTLALLLGTSLFAPALAALEAQPSATPATSRVRIPAYVDLVLECDPWGYGLVGLSFGILAMIVFATAFAGRAYRSGSRNAFSQLPKRLDSEGLAELRDLPMQSGPALSPVRRALRVGLVSGRGGLLLSKSAVLAAWDAEKLRFRFWPRMLLALGLVSLALGILSAGHQLPLALSIWQNQPHEPDSAAISKILYQAHALLTWGLTNCFISLVLFYVFDRLTQFFLDRSTVALLNYLGASPEGELASFSASPGEGA